MCRGFDPTSRSSAPLYSTIHASDPHLIDRSLSNPQMFELRSPVDPNRKSRNFSVIPPHPRDASSEHGGSSSSPHRLPAYPPKTPAPRHPHLKPLNPNDSCDPINPHLGSWDLHPPSPDARTGLIRWDLATLMGRWDHWWVAGPDRAVGYHYLKSSSVSSFIQQAGVGVLILLGDRIT